MSDLYKKIESLCQSRNLSVYRLCKEINIRGSVLSDLKNGRKKSLNTETLAKIANFFGVSVSYLLDDTQNFLAVPFSYIRKFLHWSLEDAARLCDKDLETVKSWENGTVLPDDVSLERLAKELGVTKKVLLNQDPYKRIFLDENKRINFFSQSSKPIRVKFDNQKLICLETSNKEKEKINSDFLSKEEQEHIKKYRALDEHGKEVVTTVLECEYKRYSEQKKPSDPVIMLPIYDMWETPKIIYLPEPLQPAAAGYGDPADDETADMVPVRYNDATRKADYIMRVHGDSMEPELHDGDRVLVRSQPSVEIGQMGVFLDDGERVVKVYRGDHLESLNPEYPDLPFKGFSECKGLVIGVLNPKWIAEE